MPVIIFDYACWSSVNEKGEQVRMRAILDTSTGYGTACAIDVKGKEKEREEEREREREKERASKGNGFSSSISRTLKTHGIIAAHKIWSRLDVPGKEPIVVKVLVRHGRELRPSRECWTRTGERRPDGGCGSKLKGSRYANVARPKTRKETTHWRAKGVRGEHGSTTESEIAMRVNCVGWVPRLTWKVWRRSGRESAGTAISPLEKKGKHTGPSSKCCSQTVHSLSLQVLLGTALLSRTSNRAALGAPRGSSLVCLGCVFFSLESGGVDSALSRVALLETDFLPPPSGLLTVALLSFNFSS